ncbi:haloacid dehalogenase type II [Pontibacter diazotrophicus]|uniref:Haloacid dehalogenase type II n=1 Tax=Pontibacter diazotrophicus TaxID=1400979 RepID=A0A3D8L5K3_9BACT|nr:haloacid dehalogenase type II [Pontibacter diazotrophicus]RDV12660.1 haloacid dehalogenase type II [Pontibacter diazotrophicus]
MKDIDRRSFFRKSLLSAGGVVVAPLALGETKEMMAGNRKVTSPKVIFFDVNETLLDLTPLKESVTRVLGGRKELVPLWFTTMLQFSLVATVGDQYRDFGEIGAATLQMVARNHNISLTEEKAKGALKPIHSLPAHPEVPEALGRLKNAGYTLVTLTNSSKQAVEEQMANSGLRKYFEALLSIEEVGMYKPHSRLYNWAIRKMGVSPSESLLVAAHGWDVAGAQWAGWQTAFISRPGQQLYPLAGNPEIVAPDLAQIAEKLMAAKR